MLGYNNGPRCSPVVDGNRVYTVQRRRRAALCGPRRRPAALGSSTRSSSSDVVKNFFGVGSTPIVFRRFADRQHRRQPARRTRTMSTPPKARSTATARASSPSTSSPARCVGRSTDELASYSSPVTATIDDRPWCFVFARGGLVGLDPRTGQVDFQFPWRAKMLESVNASGPVVVGNRVFISETYAVGSALLRSAARRLRSRLARRRPQPRQVARTALEHGRPPRGLPVRQQRPPHGRRAELRCVAWDTGKVQWSEAGFGRCVAALRRRPSDLPQRRRHAPAAARRRPTATTWSAKSRSATSRAAAAQLPRLGGPDP